MGGKFRVGFLSTGDSINVFAKTAKAAAAKGARKVGAPKGEAFAHLINKKRKKK